MFPNIIAGFFDFIADTFKGPVPKYEEPTQADKTISNVASEHGVTQGLSTSSRIIPERPLVIVDGNYESNGFVDDMVGLIERKRQVTRKEMREIEDSLMPSKVLNGVNDPFEQIVKLINNQKPIPQDLLDSVTAIDLSNYSIVCDHFAKMLKCFKNLRELKILRSNEDAWFENLVKYAPNLEKLLIDRCDLSQNSIESISKLSNLKFLELLFCNNTKNISSFSNLKLLEQLNIFSCDVEDIGFVRELKALSVLVLNSLKVCDVSALTGHNSIKFLSIGFCNNIADISSLADLGSIIYIRLSCLKVNDLTPIAALKTLKGLDLSLRKINDIGPIANLDKLEDLTMHMSYDLEEISAISNLKFLKYLAMTVSEKIDEQAVNSLLAALPNADARIWRGNKLFANKPMVLINCP